MSTFRWSIHSCIRYISPIAYPRYLLSICATSGKMNELGLSPKPNTSSLNTENLIEWMGERERAEERVVWCICSIIYVFSLFTFHRNNWNDIGPTHIAHSLQKHVRVWVCDCLAIEFSMTYVVVWLSTCGGSVVYLWRLIQIVHRFDSILYIDELKCQRRFEQKWNERIHADQIHSMNMISHWRDVVMTISLHSIQFQWYLPLNLCQYLSLHRPEVRERTKQKNQGIECNEHWQVTHTHPLTFIYLFVPLHSIVHIRQSKLMEKVSSIRVRIKRQWSLSSSSF